MNGSENPFGLKTLGKERRIDMQQDVKLHDTL